MRWSGRTWISLYMLMYWKCKVGGLIYKISGIVVIKRQSRVMQEIVRHGSSSLQYHASIYALTGCYSWCHWN
jgi:hypothetical protein